MATTILILWFFTILVLLVLCQMFYNVFLHPLRNFPGPLLAGATSAWKAYKEVIKQETIARDLFALHQKYGK